MTLDHLQDQPAAHLSPATTRLDLPAEIVAFKFGGSSLLGAERMLHAASLVREASQSSRVVAIVSAMKGMTDHLLGISQSLASGKRGGKTRPMLTYLRPGLAAERCSPAAAKVYGAVGKEYRCSMLF